MRYLVVGAAKSGVAAANFLAVQGEAVALYDAKPNPELPYDLHEAVVRIFGNDTDSVLDAVETVVISPGVPLTAPILQTAAKRRIPIIGEIELGYRHLRGTVIAITGTNGKSTTTALIGEILRVAGRQPIVAGNIGEPLTASLDLERPRTYVLELSSFQLETVDTFRADIALLLNITPDHLDRYEDFDAYVAAKHRVFRNQAASDVAIVNADDSRSAPRGPRGKVWKFSGTQRLDAGAWSEGDQLVLRIDGNERRIPRASLRIQGQANVENALAAWLAASAAGVDDVHVQLAFGTFVGLPHRMVQVRELDGVTWVNDSKGTNVDATLKSLEGYQSRVILILGGKDKAGEFERLSRAVREKVSVVLTIGSAATKIAESLTNAARIVPAGDMVHAVQWARENASAGDTVLLSPACASFDQYRNFEHRGEHFEELVRKLS